MAPVSDGYTRQALMLSEQEAKADENALSYLQKSLTKSRELTPEQGIAAALLAAVPSLGGYLIGKGVGSAEVPDGLYNVGKLAPTGASIGGQMGTAIGMNSAKNFVDTTNARNLLDDKNQADVYQKMSAMEQQRAARLEQQAATATNAGLALDAKVAMMPLEEASQMRIQNAASANSLSNSMALEAERATRDAIPPDMIAFAKANGIEIPVGAKSSQLNAITAAKEAMRREEGQDIRLSGQNVIPPSAKTKEKMEAVLATKSIGDRYLGKLQEVAKGDPSILERNALKSLPATELGALQQALGLFAVQVRNAREAGVMTEPDFQRYSSYLQIGNLDTIGSVMARMRELQAVTDLSARATLTAAKAGRENVKGYEELLGFSVPTTLNAKKARLEELTAKAGS